MVLILPNVLINEILFQSFQSFSNLLVFKALRTKIISAQYLKGGDFGVFRRFSVL